MKFNVTLVLQIKTLIFQGHHMSIAPKKTPSKFPVRIFGWDFFRLIQVTPLKWNSFGIHWYNRFYIDTRLTLDARLSTGIFNSSPDVAEWTIKNEFEIPHLCHLLDDFLSAGLWCEKRRSFKILLHVLNLPVIPCAKKNIVVLPTFLRFLGINIVLKIISTTR